MPPTENLARDDEYESCDVEVNGRQEDDSIVEIQWPQADARDDGPDGSDRQVSHCCISDKAVREMRERCASLPDASDSADGPRKHHDEPGNCEDAGNRPGG
jgi:hypothetical protein